jgi:hypothetical protein
MYCCNCGAQTYKDSRFCHKCGSSVPEETEPCHDSEGKQEQQLLQELMSKDRKAHVCHRCGGSGKLFCWDFGLGKPVASKRAWAGTAASLAVSAITLPLLGVGRLDLPGKKTTLSVLRLRLMLCESCKKLDGIHYSLHPWWEDALRMGYTQFLNADDLKNL